MASAAHAALLLCLLVLGAEYAAAGRSLMDVQDLQQRRDRPPQNQPQARPAAQPQPRPNVQPPPQMRPPANNIAQRPSNPPALAAPPATRDVKPSGPVNMPKPADNKPAVTGPVNAGPATKDMPKPDNKPAVTGPANAGPATKDMPKPADVKPDNKPAVTGPGSKDMPKPDGKPAVSGPGSKDLPKPDGKPSGLPAGNRPVNKGDKKGLDDKFSKPVQNLKDKPKQAIKPPTNAKGLEAYNYLTRPGLAGSAAAGAAVGFLAGAFAVSSAYAVGAMASAIADARYNPFLGTVWWNTVYTYPQYAPTFFAQTAVEVVNNGQTANFADTMAYSFAEAKRNGNIPAFAKAVADAIQQGGASAQYAFAESMARAWSMGGDSAAGVAEATAWALCQGGSTADAWASALGTALYYYPDSCGLVAQANVLSASSCGATLAVSGNVGYVAGFCGY
jgi:hypothetical protein